MSACPLRWRGWVSACMGLVHGRNCEFLCTAALLCYTQEEGSAGLFWTVEMQEHVQGHTMKSNGDGHTWGGGRRVVGNAHRSLIVIIFEA